MYAPKKKIFKTNGEIDWKQKFYRLLIIPNVLNNNKVLITYDYRYHYLNDIL